MVSTNVTAYIRGNEFQVGEEPADYWGWVKDGRYDREWMVYDEHLKPEHTFVDLGAWVGAHTLYASRTAKKLVAIEPDVKAFPILTGNIELLSPRPEIHVHRMAVTGKKGNVTLGSSALGWSTTRLNFNAGGAIEAATEFCEARSVTLRELLWEFDGPLFIKIDVEGAEEEILEDLEIFASRKPTVFIELHPFWWTDEKKTFERFSALCDLYAKKQDVATNSFLLTN